MITNQAIEHLEFLKAERYKTVVQLKVVNGELQVDVRKWFKRSGMQDFGPGKQGIMLEIGDWDQVLPLIHQIVDSNRKL